MGHAAIDVWAIGEAALWFPGLSFAERRRSRSFAFRATRCRRSLAGSGEWHRQSPESCGATPPPAAASRHRDDSAMARRARCSPPKAGEACAQRGVKNLCRGTVGWRRCGSERGSCSRPGRVLEKLSARTTEGPAMGKRLSPEQIARRHRWTSRTTRPCASAMKPSIKRCSFKVEARCAAN